MAGSTQRQTRIVIITKTANSTSTAITNEMTGTTRLAGNNANPDPTATDAPAPSNSDAPAPSTSATASPTSDTPKPSPSNPPPPPPTSTVTVTATATATASPAPSSSSQAPAPSSSNAPSPSPAPASPSSSAPSPTPVTVTAVRSIVAAVGTPVILNNNPGAAAGAGSGGGVAAVANVPTSVPGTTDSSGVTGSDSADRLGGASTSSTVTTVGSVVGALAGIALIAVVAFLVVRRRRSTRHAPLNGDHLTNADLESSLGGTTAASTPRFRMFQKVLAPHPAMAPPVPARPPVMSAYQTSPPPMIPYGNSGLLQQTDYDDVGSSPHESEYGIAMPVTHQVMPSATAAQFEVCSMYTDSVYSTAGGLMMPAMAAARFGASPLGRRVTSMATSAVSSTAAEEADMALPHGLTAIDLIDRPMSGVSAVGVEFADSSAGTDPVESVDALTNAWTDVFQEIEWACNQAARSATMSSADSAALAAITPATALEQAASRRRRIAALGSVTDRDPSDPRAALAAMHRATATLPVHFSDPDSHSDGLGLKLESSPSTAHDHVSPALAARTFLIVLRMMQRFPGLVMVVAQPDAVYEPGATGSVLSPATAAAPTSPTTWTAGDLVDVYMDDGTVTSEHDLGVGGHGVVPRYLATVFPGLVDARSGNVLAQCKVAVAQY
ncbi:hypothetical protein AMAG_03882 [Allomyces macrogynus ATCC 38327]|uniref:Uncharacterized protein n=1 Tax=Allomyces macrogynus (strain ATCC 38327) TaxID=578462 RepID=A0A0L0SAV6_ALLM3|nr:hypothetical protein AMAG_03882 [Allomyces macrogynus ATCC 38327]|eukprot:KNE59626.1 hypothetical protein AMAG_03882 [Allomyces macrogynus ATCC 38327]